jgi:hypothetical protein
LFVNIWVAVIRSFLTIYARMGRVMKRGVLQNTRPCLQAHYSSLGPARGLMKFKQKEFKELKFLPTKGGRMLAT